jgi:hypothetical protein
LIISETTDWFHKKISVSITKCGSTVLLGKFAFVKLDFHDIFWQIKLQVSEQLPTMKIHLSGVPLNGQMERKHTHIFLSITFPLDYYFNLLSFFSCAVSNSPFSMTFITSVL